MNSLNDLARAAEAVAKNQDALDKVFAQVQPVSAKLFGLAQIIGDPEESHGLATLDEVNRRRGHA